MNELKIFEHPEFGKVRTVEIDGEPWLVGKDVAAALGYSNPRKALDDHVDPEDKMQGDGVTIRDSIGREQHPTIINESGLYSLVLSSKLPGARKFRRWVTAEVLPEIRRTGKYTSKKSKETSDSVKAKLNNSRARLASVWMKIANVNPIPEYQQICAHYASAELTGGEAVLPLPKVAERTYTAKEVGDMLGGISANMVGRMANQNKLKTPEYGVEVWDKSRNSAKQVATWRYNEKAVARLREILDKEQSI